MNTLLIVLGALAFFATIFGPFVLAIFRDPFYGDNPGPLSDWYMSLKERALNLPTRPAGC